VWVLGSDGTTVSVSSAIVEFLGYREEEILGRSPWDFSDEEGAAIAREAIERRARGEQDTYEMKWVRRDGETVWGLVSAAPLSDAKDAYQGSLALITDITERRRNQEHRRRLAAIVESSSDAVVGLDRDGRVRDVNAAAITLCGLPWEEIEGRLLAEVLVPPEPSEALRLIEEVLRGTEIPKMQTPVRRHDGAHLDIWVSLAPIHDPGGRVSGVSVVARDVTEERRTQRRLARLARQQEAVATLGRRALEGASIEALEHEAVAVVAEVLGAPYATLLERSAGSDELVARAVHGIPADVVARHPVPPGAMPRAEALTAAQPVHVTDWEEEQRLVRPELTVVLAIRGSHGAVVAGRTSIGVLAAHRTERWDIVPDETSFLQGVANVLSAARERAEAEEEMRHRALHDPLTGLPNRTLVADRLSHALERSRVRGTTTALFLLDLDQFKVINDSLGHEAGDQLLHTVGPRLTRAVRPVDTVGRLGGDEFVVVCEDLAGPEEAAQVASSLVGAFAPPVMLDGEPHVVTASVGIALDTDGTSSASDLLRNADAAMYRAKERGRGKFEVFDEELRERTLERLHLERDLRGALGRGELWLAFQPIVDIARGGVIGVEALLRWSHPERGAISPATFIPIAEESGLIGEIGAWVLREACAQAARWGVGVQVNVSPRQIADATLPSLVRDTLAATGLDASRLTLEITEGTVMDPRSDPVDVLQALGALGLQIVLDDFGTGYSSLSRLRGLPIHGLKIDRSFVADLGRPGSPSELLVGGVIQVCSALGVGVVAEGVETEAQRDHLLRLGCVLAQGFLMARPMPAKAVAQHLSPSS
jgi:diguanylate cyclase (GGDEF)-like protein/PAS domain S-box-containing protein